MAITPQMLQRHCIRPILAVKGEFLQRRITAARMSRIRSRVPDGGIIIIAFLRGLRKLLRGFWQS
jgi:hypothetical protein